MNQHTTKSYTWSQLSSSPAWNLVSHTKTRRILVKDNLDPQKRTINDPRYGGLFAFGLVIARPSVPGELPADPADFWNEVWEFTSRTLPFRLPGEQTDCLTVNWGYEFSHNMNQLKATVVATPQPHRPDLWYKEPKLSFNGLLGYKTLEVFDVNSRSLGTFDLRKYTNPVRKTCQIPYPTRYRYVLRPKSTQFPNLTITFDQKDWNPWVRPANAQPPLSDMRFVLENLVDLAALSQLPGYEHAEPEMVLGVLEESGRFFAQEYAPLNRTGDTQHSRRNAEEDSSRWRSAR